MTKRQRPLKETPVRSSVSRSVDQLEHVEITTHRVRSIANEWADDEFDLPSWRAPVFPDENKTGTTIEDVIDFLFVGNSINFSFRDFETGEKFSAAYGGTEWDGAFGMWACLKRAYDAGVPILSGKYLATLSRMDVERLFSPADGREIPMLDERYRILRDIGDCLVSEYDGRFHRFVEEASPRLYADGNGIVECLVTNFPKFNDEHILPTTTGGLTVRIYKRAQLAPAMAFGRFAGSDGFHLEDPESCTVFADYNLPNVLRHLEIIQYDDHLSTLVDNERFLETGSREEVEIRVATIAAADQLMDELNKRRETPVYGPHMDYRLFTERDNISTPIHKTRTTDY